VTAIYSTVLIEGNHLQIKGMALNIRKWNGRYRDLPGKFRIMGNTKYNPSVFRKW